MTAIADEKVPFLRGNIQTAEQAEKVIKRAANAFLIMCGLFALTMGANFLQRATGNTEEMIGILIGNIIGVCLFLIPALILKKRRSSIAAKFLLGICGLFFAFGLYLLFVLGVMKGDHTMSMTGAIILLWWACFIRLALRADYAAKVLKKGVA